MVFWLAAESFRTKSLPFCVWFPLPCEFRKYVGSGRLWASIKTLFVAVALSASATANNKLIAQFFISDTILYRLAYFLAIRYCFISFAV